MMFCLQRWALEQRGEKSILSRGERGKQIEGHTCQSSRSIEAELQVLGLSMDAPHKHIITPMAIVMKGDTVDSVIVEHCAESLSTMFTRQCGIFSPGMTQQIFSHVVSGVAHLHERKIAHRDLKLENLLLAHDADGTWRVILVDFGFCTALQDASSLTATICCPLVYRPPEIQLGGKHGLPCDIRTLGLCLREVLLGRRVYETALGDTDKIPLSSLISPSSKRTIKAARAAWKTQPRLHTIVEERQSRGHWCPFKMEYRGAAPSKLAMSAASSCLDLLPQFRSTAAALCLHSYIQPAQAEAGPDPPKRAGIDRPHKKGLHHHRKTLDHPKEAGVDRLHKKGPDHHKQVVALDRPKEAGIVRPHKKSFDHCKNAAGHPKDARADCSQKAGHGRPRYPDTKQDSATHCQCHYNCRNAAGQHKKAMPERPTSAKIWERFPCSAAPQSGSLSTARIAFAQRRVVTKCVSNAPSASPTQRQSRHKHPSSPWRLTLTSEAGLISQGWRWAHIAAVRGKRLDRQLVTVWSCSPHRSHVVKTQCDGRTGCTGPKKMGGGGCRTGR